VDRRCHVLAQGLSRDKSGRVGGQQRRMILFLEGPDEGTFAERRPAPAGRQVGSSGQGSTNNRRQGSAGMIPFKAHHPLTCADSFDPEPGVEPGVEGEADLVGGPAPAPNPWLRDPHREAGAIEPQDLARSCTGSRGAARGVCDAPCRRERTSSAPSWRHLGGEASWARVRRLSSARVRIALQLAPEPGLAVAEEPRS
jgi:hypothetical protein